MSDKPAVSKAELLRQLRESGAESLVALRALPAEAFSGGRYENGWDARQILAHMAAIEWTYPRLLQIPAAPDPATAGAEPPTISADGGIDAYNARQVAKRETATVAELLDELEKNRAATIAAVEAADEGDLGRRIRSAGGRVGPVSNVFVEVAVDHVREHTRDITG